jgi:nucleotide-binding universal stress UspA family protein
MSAAFHKILFSVSTEIAVKKAIGLIETEEAEIHLLHVVRARGKYPVWKAGQDLDQWRAAIEEHAPRIKVYCGVIKAYSIRKVIIQYAQLLQPDLIIIGKQANRRLLPWFHPISPDYIAQKSNCPILTLKPGSVYNRIKLIVIPVRDFVPERKLELAILIAKQYKAQVHLLTIQHNDKSRNGPTGQAFLQAYHQLREKLRHPVEYSLSTRQDLAKATLDYAESVKADMVLVNPETESGITSFAGSRHISDLLMRDSKLQVLDVQPY